MSTLLFRLSAPKRKCAPLFTPMAKPEYQACAPLTTTTDEFAFTDGFQPLIVPGSKVAKMKTAGPEFPPCDTTKSVVLVSVLATCPVSAHSKVLQVGGTATCPCFTPLLL